MNKIISIKSYKETRGDQNPDIDLDFLAEKRDEVKTFFEKRYGKDHVCSIGSYTTMKLKAGLKDLSRVDGLQFKYINFVTKDIDHQLEYEWKDLIKYGLNSGILYEFIQKHHNICDLLQFCNKQARASSIHASAIVVTPKHDKDGNSMTIFDWMPIKLIDGVLVSEWDGKNVDKALFLKEDILGLNQLDKFKMVLNLIKENHDKNIILEELLLDDEKTYKLFKKGYAEDVFQFGTSGLKAYCKQVKPDNIEELTAMNALFRPGSMESGSHNDFALIKHGKKKAKYDYGMQEVTKNTQSLFVYQEQIMQAMIVAGMSAAESDTIRTSIKKFDKKLMGGFKDKFIRGMIDKMTRENHFSQDYLVESTLIWDKLMSFSKYGFNKAHSAAYSIMGYWSQYLKAHYPLEFWTTSLQFSKPETVSSRLQEIDKINPNILVKPPSINNSNIKFSCISKTQTIYWSLSKIKGLGEKTVDHIIEIRDYYGNFLSLDDFIDKVKKSKVNKAKIAALIISGCFDEIENLSSVIDRKYLLCYYYEKIGQEIDIKYLTDDSFEEYFWILLQKELTGFGIIDFKKLIKDRIKSKNFYISYKTADEFLKPNQDWNKCVIAGVLFDIYEKSSKKGKFGILKIESNNNIITCLIWSEKYKEFSELINASKGKLIALSGAIKYDDYNGGNSLFSNDNTQIYIL